MSKEYIIYHIPGKKIGVTCDLYNRVTEQQGYEVGEYEVIETSDDIDYISKRELKLQKKYGYRVDLKPYNELSNNLKLKNMKINVTEQTTTFPCPVNKLKGQLMDNLEMQWEIEEASFDAARAERVWSVEDIDIVKSKCEEDTIEVVTMSDEERLRFKEATEYMYEKYDDMFTPGLLQSIKYDA